MFGQSRSNCTAGTILTAAVAALAAPGYAAPAPAGSTVSRPASPATRPADALANRMLSAEETAAYRAELRMIPAVYTLEEFRAVNRETKQAAQQRAAGESQAADEKARAMAETRSRVTRDKLLRRRPRKAVVINRHYNRLHDINQERQATRNAASAEALRARQAAGVIERDLAVLERTMRSLALAGVHAKYGQWKLCSSLLGQGLGTMPAALTILESTDDPTLRDYASEGLEQAFVQTTEEISRAEPAMIAALLTSQHAALKGALSLPASKGLAASVAETWQAAANRLELSELHSTASAYWIRQADQLSQAAAPAAGSR